MLRVVGIGQQLLCLLRRAPRQQQPHANPRSLPGDSAVSVQDVLDVLGNLLVLCPKGSKAWRGTGESVDWNAVLKQESY